MNGPDPDLGAQVAGQRRFFAAGHTRDTAARRAALEQLRGAFHEHERQLYEALAGDFRKPEAEVYFTELFLALGEVGHAIDNLERWARPRRVDTPLYQQPGTSHVVPQPYGVALIIAPWNYPFQLAFLPLIAAVAAGNCAVVKPSERAPRTAALIAEIISRAFEPDHVTAVLGGAEVGERLLACRFDYIFFTGSGAVGRRVLGAAAPTLTPVTLELGGKNPCVVDRSADPVHAARRIAWGKFINAGQSCVAPDYVLVHSSLERQLLEQLTHQIELFYGAAPQTSPDYARMVDRRQLDRLRPLLAGGRALVGGAIDEADLYVAPTVLTEVDPAGPLMREEIFGPLLPVLPFETLEEALAAIASHPRPLALYVFADDRDAERTLVERTATGGVCVNDVLSQMTTTALPFGGIGESGMGRYHGRHGFETFSHRRAVMRKSRKLDGAFFRYPPYAARARWIARLKKLYR